MRIRAAAPADAVAIADLHVRSWQAAYRGIIDDAYLDAMEPAPLLPNLQWSLERSHEAWRMWVADDGDGTELLGFASTGPSQDVDAPRASAELFALYVDPARVRTGIGSALLRHALTEVRALGSRTITSWVFADDAIARRFLEKHRWREDQATNVEVLGEENVPTVRYRAGLDL